MTKSINVRPADPGDRFRCPDSGVKLDAKGGKVPDSPWWQARIREGRVIDVDAEKAAEAKAAKGKAPEKGKAGGNG